MKSVNKLNRELGSTERQRFRAGGRPATIFISGEPSNKGTDVVLIEDDGSDELVTMRVLTGGIRVPTGRIHVGSIGKVLATRLYPLNVPAQLQFGQALVKFPGYSEARVIMARCLRLLTEAEMVSLKVSKQLL